MFPDLEFIKTCLNGLRSRIEKVENWVVSFVRVNRPNWAQNDPDALDYIKGRTHYEVNGRVVQLPSKFLPSPTSNAVGAIKADAVKTTDIQPVRLGIDGKLYSSGIPIFTTSGTGSAYTANVPEINELVNGMLVVMIPHETSGSTSPTLNINGLGARQIRRFKSSGSTNNYSGSYSNWLYPGVPVLLMYNSGFWFACNFTKPDANDLLGQVYALHGGTGRSFLTKGSYLVGNGTGSVLLKTPSEVLADIGAIPVPATASVGQVIAVKAVDEDGKPTEWEAADMASGKDDVPVYLGTIPVSTDTVSYLVAPVKDYKKVVIVKERASANNNLTSYLYARLYQPETKKNFILAGSNKTGYSFFACKLECVSNDFVEGGMVYSNNATLTPVISGMIPHSSVFSNSMINQNMPIDIDSYYYEFDVANASLAFDGSETVHVWGWKR